MGRVMVFTPHSILLSWQQIGCDRLAHWSDFYPSGDWGENMTVQKEKVWCTSGSKKENKTRDLSCELTNERKESWEREGLEK